MTPENASYWLFLSPSIKLALCILKYMISGGTSKNGTPFTIFSTWLQKSWILDNITAYMFVIFLSAKYFILLYLRPWPVCMHTHQMFPPTFMSAADFVVANVMFSSILPARHQAVKLFQSSEVNASKPQYFARRSRWNAEQAYRLGKRFSVWWKWTNRMLWGISSCNWMWYLSHSLMDCKGRCLRMRSKNIQKMKEFWLHSITRWECWLEV